MVLKNKKAQGAMEYLMTYGWAILVVIIVGIALFGMGILDLGGGGTTTFTGFSKLKPIDWVCNGNTLTVQFANGAGRSITNVQAAGSGVATCPSGTIPRGDNATCAFTSDYDGTNITCTTGEAYSIKVGISYDAVGGLSDASVGTVKGVGS